ncbi:MAG: tRNA (guanosine(37)-N1)-methyltransferase TrmD [Gammaproteobacteria bacterium]|nr:tRNA (guanosine(37)-N1)-methyltransferase TrmD [Gammaproteobacteria bacterium]
MRVGVISLFPDMFRAVTAFGVSGRAVERGLLEVLAFNPRDFAKDAHRTVDDRPYGGGPGMVMMVAPLRDAVRAARSRLSGAGVIYLSPQGRRMDRSDIVKLAGGREVILVAGRYEGVDERFVAAEVDEEWSIGDFVVSGGELPAMMLIDAVARMLPGVLGHGESAAQDSFESGLLDHPHYTRPEEIDGRRVPAVLLSGDHEQIRRWRLRQALGRTWKRRPDLLAALRLDAEQAELLEQYVRESAHEQDGENPA